MAPLIVQVNVVTLQLSVTTGLGMATKASQLPVDVKTLLLAGQVMTGATLSLMVIV